MTFVREEQGYKMYTTEETWKLSDERYKVYWIDAGEHSLYLLYQDGEKITGHKDTDYIRSYITNLKNKEAGYCSDSHIRNVESERRRINEEIESKKTK